MTVAPVGAVAPRNAAEWIAFFEKRHTDRDTKPPRIQLMALPDLLRAVRKVHSAGDRSNPAGIAISDAEFDWLRRFDETVRNQFVHFAPMGWSLEVSGFPGIAVLSARIIDEIVSIGWGFRHKDRSWRDALRTDLATLAAGRWITS